MKWLWLWRFLCGYGMITVEGCLVENLLETLRGDGVLIWDVHRTMQGVKFQTTVHGIQALHDWKQSHPHAALQVIPCGRLRVMEQAKRHLPLLFAMLCAAALLIFASQFYWRTDLSGVPKSLQADTQCILQEAGIEFPIRKRDVERDLLRDRLLLQLPQLCFAEVRSRGVTLCIDSVLRDLPPDVFDPSAGKSDIIAPCDGQIESISATVGRAMVSAGDAVQKGDVLIEGIAGREGFERDVQAQGLITMRMFYTQTHHFSTEDLMRETGTEQTSYRFVAGEFSFPLGEENTLSPAKQEVRKIELLPNIMPMPVYLEQVTCRELELPDLQTQVFYARQLALARTMAQLEEDAVVIDTEYKEEIRSDGVRITCTLTAKINIAATQEVYVK